MRFPNLGPDLGEEFGRLLLQAFAEYVAETIPEGSVVKQECSARRHPAASVRAETAAGDEVMHVRMLDERATPGVQHAEHAELRAQTTGMAGQVQQRLAAGDKEPAYPHAR